MSELGNFANFEEDITPDTFEAATLAELFQHYNFFNKVLWLCFTGTNIEDNFDVMCPVADVGVLPSGKVSVTSEDQLGNRIYYTFYGNIRNFVVSDDGDVLIRDDVDPRIMWLMTDAPQEVGNETF